MNFKKKLVVILAILSITFTGVGVKANELQEYNVNTRVNANYAKGRKVKQRRVGGYSQNDVTVRSNLTQQQIEQLLPIRMKQLAPAIYKIDKSNKPINAFFLISLVRLETGNGTSYSYRTRNNVGGVMGRRGLRTFRSKDECLYYMQDFLYRGYINNGRKSVWRIGSKYCVGGNWAGKINRMAVNTMYKSYELR